MKLLKKIVSAKSPNTCYRVLLKGKKTLIQVENSIADKFDIESKEADKIVSDKVENQDFILSSKNERIISIFKADI